MYICIFKGITDKQLEEAQLTSKSFNEICKKLGLGSECGACVKEAIQKTMTTKSQKDTNNRKPSQTA